MFRSSCLFGGWILSLSLMAFTAHAQPTITNVHVGTAFRYQGAVRGVFPNSVFPSGAQNGTLQFQFGLWDDPVNTNAASQMASNLFTTLNVSNGFFSTMLDFGDVFKGRRAFLEVAVFAPLNTFPASSNWITVSPRTEIGAVPYAMWALKGGTEVLRSHGFSWKSFYPEEYDGYDGASVPGGFMNSSAGTNYSSFQVRSAPQIVEEARILVGSVDSYTDCPSCYFATTLEVWRRTNLVWYPSPGRSYFYFRPEFVRNLSAPINVGNSNVTVGTWIPLILTNSIRTLNAGEFLRLVTRDSGFPEFSRFSMYLTGEAVVRDAP